jgi:hypothetical protein
MTPREHVAYALADTFLAGQADPTTLIEGARHALGERWRWIPYLCRALLKRTGEHFHSFSRNEIAAFILEHEGFCEAWQGPRPHPSIRHYCLDLPRPLARPPWLIALDLPDLPAVGELARWLEVSPNELEWFADQWRIDRATTPALQHYHYNWRPKRNGGLRLIEIPKQRLRAMQGKILRELLDRVPPHAAAHGFRRGHSCLTHAARHTGQRVVVRIDLKDFFPSITAGRIHALFARLGYADRVAAVLARLCTHRTPANILRQPAGANALTTQQKQTLRDRHLPQGSPCSPALANLCAHRLDMRLEALARSLGATYSRYADDLTFSGPREFERALVRFHVQVATIAIEEGFAINRQKTRIMRAAARQEVTGIVVNRHPNIARRDYDALKATLTNCLRHGAASQNREGRQDFRAHLAGRVAHVKMVNEARGRRLGELLARVEWDIEP